MLNQHIKDAAMAVKSITSKSNGLWGSLATFVHEHSSQDADALKAIFKAQEAACVSELKVKLGENSTYRVVKSVLVKARLLSIALVDDDGKLRGKTDIEDAIKAALYKEPATAYERYTDAVVKAQKQVEKLTAQEVVAAAAVASELLSALEKKLQVRVAA